MIVRYILVQCSSCRIGVSLKNRTPVFEIGSLERETSENQFVREDQNMGNKLQRTQETNEPVEQVPEEEESSNFTCEICIEPMLSKRKFKNGGLCTHPFCLDCISKYVEVKVEGFVGNIKCPGLSCKHSLDPHSCRPIISKPLFVKWSDLLCESVTLRGGRCYCPYRDCSALILNECSENLKKVKCPNCKKHFCYRCKIPWHAGYQCSKSGRLRDRNDILIGELIEEKKWTRCYNCGHSVERVSGCRDIKCKCGVRFCHQCGRRFHLGPCRHKCCGDAFCMMLFLLILLVFCYLFYHQLNLISPSA